MALGYQNPFYLKQAQKKQQISKPILTPDDEFLDDTPKKSVAWKFLNKVKDTIVTLQRAEFLKEAANFVRDYKSLAKEADESLKKIKVLEYENERLLRAIVSQDIMSIMQNHYVVDTSNLQTELERTSANTKFSKPAISITKRYSVTLFPKTQFLPKVVENNDLTKVVTSHS
ncbi:hypothetical protein Tco_0127332, partial [Tanacetum coccineum]